MLEGPVAERTVIEYLSSEAMKAMGISTDSRAIQLDHFAIYSCYGFDSFAVLTYMSPREVP